jgi:hypothetical protein
MIFCRYLSLNSAHLTIRDAGCGQWLKSIWCKSLIRGLDLNARKRWRMLMNNGLNPPLSSTIASP